MAHIESMRKRAEKKKEEFMMNVMALIYGLIDLKQESQLKLSAAHSEQEN